MSLKTRSSSDRKCSMRSDELSSLPVDDERVTTGGTCTTGDPGELSAKLSLTVLITSFSCSSDSLHAAHGYTLQRRQSSFAQ